ncbi:MAG: tetratricopeptide repeat protein [Bdellovibrionales bacterium]|nr:tetratricopeptide repeat protein [Bdellovibrionales bacterium]
MSRTKKAVLICALMPMAGCSTLGFPKGSSSPFISSAARVEGDAPASMAIPDQSKEQVDDVYMQTKADYHFTMAESYSLQEDPAKAVENYKLALVYDQSSAQIRYRLALEYVKLGLVSEAVSQCQEALSIDEKHKDAALLLGGLYSAMHLFDKALGEYEKVLKFFPNDLEASLFIGALYAEKGEFKTAINHFLKLSRNKAIEDKSQVWYYLGRIYSSQPTPSFKNAESAYVTSLKLDPEAVEVVLALGSLYEQNKKLEKAKRLYSSYQDEHGSHYVVAERLAQLYLASDNMEKAQQQLRVVESFDPENLNTSLKIALILIEQKKYKEAINKLENILQRSPDSEKVRFYLGALYEEVKNYRAAIQQFETIKFGSSYFEDAIMHGAYLYKLLGNFDSAIETVKRGLYHQNNNPKFWVLHASLLDENNNIKEARAVLSKAAQMFPDDKQVHFQLGSVYDRLGQKDKTVEHMEKVIDLDADHVQALNYLAYVYAEATNNLDQAEKLARKALNLQPEDGYIMDTLGWVLFKQNRLQEAVKLLEKAHAKEKKESIIAEHLGDAYFRYKLHRKAKDMYMKAKELEKDKLNQEKIQSKIYSIEKKLQAESQDPRRQPASQ